jgi:acyl-CoA thioesterase-1
MRIPGTTSARLAAALLILGALGLSTAARSQVVAFGASQISQRGVEAGAAYPAQLEALLKAKGYNVTVDNEAASEDTTQDLLKRLDAAIPPGTKVVILDLSGGYANDYRRGITHAQGKADYAAMSAKLKAQGIKVIEESTADLPAQYRQKDGLHLTAEGHRFVATRLLPLVIEALGPPA